MLRDVMSFNPFVRMNDMMQDMHGLFGNMARQMEDGVSNGDGAMYGSSTFMSYNNMDGGEPKIYQATSATRAGPGGIRETRKTERNTVTGTDKMAVGRHINERGHVITKQRDRRTGQIDELQDFENMDEAETDQFDNEWSERASAYFGRQRRGHGELGYNYHPSSDYTNNHRAIKGRDYENDLPSADDIRDTERDDRKKNKNKDRRRQ
jgi:hypothetical protein